MQGCNILMVLLVMMVTVFNRNCNGSCGLLLVNGWPSIGGLLKPLNANGICPKTHSYRKLFVWF